MSELLLYRIFECAIVVFEAFIIQQYLNGLFEKRHEEKNALLWYVLYCSISCMLTLYFVSGIVLTIYALIGCFVLATILYKVNLSSRIIATFFFALLMMVTEIVSSALLDIFFKIPVPDMLVYGTSRVLYSLVTKLIQIFLVKGITAVFSRWTSHSSDKSTLKMMIPLLLCQIILILTAYYVALNCMYLFGSFSATALIVVVGIIYISIIIFWYFDRLKAAFEYKSRSEAAEYKLALEKQYHQILNEHQQETDALWHDMKKHIGLMKALIADGAQPQSAQYIRDLEVEMDNSLKIIRTGYPVLSALLTEQKRRAKQADVPYDIDVRLEGDLKIEDIDLCVILDNLFDNALEACTLLPDDADRKMQVDIKQRNNAISIRFVNTFDATSRKKWHPGKHGLGLKNVRQAVHKYGGDCRIKEEDNIFSVAILIP